MCLLVLACETRKTIQLEGPERETRPTAYLRSQGALQPFDGQRLAALVQVVVLIDLLFR